MCSRLITLSLIIAVTRALKTPSNEDYYQAAVVEYHRLRGKDSNDTFLINAEKFVELIKESSNIVNEDYYQAAVLEYHRLRGKNSNDTFLTNAEKFVELIKESSNFADIVVFPESSMIFEEDSVYVKVPSGDEKVIPAHSQEFHPVLIKLSQAAIDNEVYVIVNLHEEAEVNGTILRYNTNVAFDRKGTVVARYRKFHLFLENLNITAEPEIIYFDSDFGVRFGTFTCFDIMFEQPAKGLLASDVTDFIFPTYWFSELPFLTAIQAQSGWSFVHDANLLAAGGNFPETGTTGSGIYNGRKGPVVYRENRVNENRILSAKIFKKGKEGTSEDTSQGRPPDPSSIKELFLFHDNMTYKTESLLPSFKESDYTRFNTSDPNKYELKRNVTIKDHVLCQCNFCCHFDIDMTITYRSKDYIDINDESYLQQDSLYHFQYRMAAFDGVRGFTLTNTGGQQFCAVISCLNSNDSSCMQTLGTVTYKDLTWENNQTIALYKTSFSNILIRSSNFTTVESFLFPNILEASRELYEFGNVTGLKRAQFNTNTQNETSLKISSDKLITAGLFSRVFDRDGKTVGPNDCSVASTSYTTHILVYILTFLIIYSST